MSSIRRLNLKCAICGNLHEYIVINTPKTFIGLTDLDTRPHAMLRSTIIYDLQKCPNCHYCNTNIEVKLPNIDLKLLQSHEYKEIVNLLINVNVKKFLLAAYLYKMNNDYKLAGYLYLKAAWIFDDLYDDYNATKIRKKAAKYIEKYLDNNVDLDYETILIDVLRRGKEFEKAIEKAINLKQKVKKNTSVEKMIDFEIKLAKEHDTGCYNFNEIPKKYTI